MRRGELTGRPIGDNIFQVMVYPFMGRICVDLVDLRYGPEAYSELTEAWHYSSMLGDVLYENDFEPELPLHYEIAVQVDRSARCDALWNLPPELLSYVQVAIQQHRAERYKA